MVFFLLFGFYSLLSQALLLREIPQAFGSHELSLAAALASWLRKEDPYNPVPYLMVRAMRWGELRAAGGEIDPNLLEPPSTTLRTEIKRLYNDGDYDQLFTVMEAAAAEPCGRGLLDLQRYFSTATWPVLYTTVNSLEKRSFSLMVTTP